MKYLYKAFVSVSSGRQEIQLKHFLQESTYLQSIVNYHRMAEICVEVNRKTL
jgi:hypothetical protein